MNASIFVDELIIPLVFEERPCMVLFGSIISKDDTFRYPVSLSQELTNPISSPESRYLTFSFKRKSLDFKVDLN